MQDARFWKAHEQYLTPPDEDEGVECHQCEGTGKESGKCCSCDGTGGHWVAADHDPEPCEDCEGAGIYKSDCERCEGYGNVSRDFERREIEEERADRAYDEWKDRKLEEEK